jgi:hypothetical protein
MAFRAAKQLAGNSAGSRPLPLMQVAGKASRALGELNADLRAGGFGGSAQGLGRELYASFTATIVATKGSDAESMAWAIGRALVVDLDRAGFRRGASILLGGLIEFGSSHADPKILERLRKTEEELRRKPGWRWRSSSPSSPEPRRGPPPESAANKPANKAETKAPPPRQPQAAAAPATPRPPAAETPPPEPPLILTKEAPPIAPAARAAAPEQPVAPARPQGESDLSADAAQPAGREAVGPARADEPERSARVESHEPDEAPAAVPAEAAAEPPEMLDLFARLPEWRPKIGEPPAPALPEAAAPRDEPPHPAESPAPGEAAPVREEAAAETPVNEAMAEQPETLDGLAELPQWSEADEPASPTTATDATAGEVDGDEAQVADELGAAAAAEPPAEIPAGDAAAEPPAVIPAAVDEPAASISPVMEVAADEPDLDGAQEPDEAAAAAAVEATPAAMPDEAVAGPEAFDPFVPLSEPPAEPGEPPAAIPPLPEAAVPEQTEAEPDPKALAPEGPIPEHPALDGPAEERPIFDDAAEPDPLGTPELRAEADESAEAAPPDLAAEAPEEIPPAPTAESQPAVAFQETAPEAAKETAPAAFAVEAPRAPEPGETVADEPAKPAPRKGKRRGSLRLPPAGIRFDPAPRLGRPYDAPSDDGEEKESAAPPIGRREPRLSARLLGDPDLRFETDERPVPPPDPAARRKRSRAASGLAIGATTAVLGLLVYLLVSQDGRFLRYFQSTAPSVASLPSVEPATHAVASNASTANASQANPSPANPPPAANPSAGPSAASPPAASPPAASPSAASASTAEASPSNASAVGAAATGVPANSRPFVTVPEVTASTMTASTGTASTGSASTGSAAPAPAAAPPMASPEPAEKLPPQGVGALLSEEEVRYCVFQGRRLGYLRNQVIGDEAIQRFNTLVADFNSRCRNFRYDNNALQIATEQAGVLETQLRADAANILASWAPGAASSPAGTLVAGSPLIDLQSREGAAAVQARLKELGYYQRSVDGRWGPRSAAALASFRQDKGLGPNGIWDISTQSALLGQ